MVKKAAGRPFKNADPRELTVKQELAITEFMNNGGKKADAMRAAGYSETFAKTRHSYFFNLPQVQARLELRRKRLAKRHDLTQDWIIKRFMDMADAGNTLAKFKKIGEDGELFWDFTGATEEDLALVSELSYDYYTEGRGDQAKDVKKFKVTLPDRKAALDSLARHLGLFNDKLQVTTDPVKTLQEARNQALKRNQEVLDENGVVHTKH